MGDATKISPHVPSTPAQNEILLLLILQDCKSMGDTAKISSPVRSTSAQHGFLSLLTTHIVPSRQMNVATDNPSLIPSVSCLTTGSHLRNDVCAADNISHSENLQSNGCWCFSHLYKFPDWIQVS
jgi:hypothetical protein